jgi:peptide/nickel transport system permease protein
MASFIFKRVLSTIAVLFLVSVVAFVLLRVSPGNPARQVLGPQASAQAVENLREQMGLNDSLPQQYVTYVGDLATGDFGLSWRTRVPVSDELTTRLPASMELALFAILLSIIVAVPVGLAAAAGGRWVDRTSRAGAVVGLGTPPFWLGLVLILVFFTWLSIAPAPFGRLDDSIAPPPEVTGFLTVDSLLAGRWDAFRNALAHLILPAITLGLPLAAYLSRMVRRSTADVYRLDFIRTARAKGASERRVMLRHALPNALLPVLTLSALYIGELIAGSLLVEAVFSWPGVGGWVAESILAQDFAPVQGAILLGALTYCLLNLAADLLYGVADPRIRISRD